ncbi:MAG: acetate--CoA ligase [Candidatus Aenigmarchaeota archaeon]|nr:acetate--CoA ligase [Candidatus Aenigmarchaeota archaeon]
MTTKWIVEDKEKENVFWPSEEMKKAAWVSDPKIYDEALKDQKAFWAEKAGALHWEKKWDNVYEQEPGKPWNFKWFVGGKINAAYNCLDRHVEGGKGDKVAMIWVPEPTDEKPVKITYSELNKKVNKFANALKKLGIKKGDRVGVYLPMIPELMISLLAVARIGAVHNVVFSAFSGESVKDRMEDAEAKLLITANGYYRRGKLLDLKKNADIGVEGTPVKNVVVVKRAELDVNWVDGRDHWFHELIEKESEKCESEFVEANDMLFMLYTSGTTGKPKGIVHDTAGYLTQAYWTTKWNFNAKDDDVFWCTADVGWITGHTYGCYGPFSNGITQIVFEGAPDYPDIGRWWKTIQDHKVSVFYTAPTAIRMFIKAGDAWPKKYNLESLKILGSVGEPIDEEAWLWYFRTIGGGRCPIIDTWWQTETGANVVNTLPGIGPFIPTVAGRPFPGIDMKLVDEEGNDAEMSGYLVEKPPFAPGMLRGIYKNEQKYIDTYWSRFKNLYDTSDGAKLREDGLIRITGRVDDVMKVAGHRLSTGELENAINEHELVRESAVVPRPDKIKGEVPIVFALLIDPSKATEETKAEIVRHVDKMIGPTARPAAIYFVDDVPKTRSGKIMRRILRGLVTNDTNLGNVTTLMNPECVEHLKEVVGYGG